MQYRVKFNFRYKPNGYYFTEWYDTVAEAVKFIEDTDTFGELRPMYIEDSDGDIV